MGVTDFTSALYLGMHHPSRALKPWAQFSMGVPAALHTPALAARLAASLARLQGCEAALLAPSTLHLAWDVLGLLSRSSSSLLVDSDVYPVLRWGIERAAGRGTPVRFFPHHDVEALRRALLRKRSLKRRPLIITDGWCPRCGKAAPLQAYLDIVRPFDGRVLIDDTQALGILGKDPTPDAPYGRGGGGLLRWCNVASPNVLVISSLAKGFGVPMAALSGSHAFIRHFKAKSETRVHCSPPSMATLHAAEHALRLNRSQGNTLREHLLRLVRRFRLLLAEVGLSVRGRLFPVQVLDAIPGLSASRLQAGLLEAGIRTVLLHTRPGVGADLCFILNARHSVEDLVRTVTILRALIAEGTPHRRLPLPSRAKQ